MVDVGAGVVLRAVRVAGKKEYVSVAEAEEVGATAVLAPIGKAPAFVEGMQVFPVHQIFGAKQKSDVAVGFGQRVRFVATDRVVHAVFHPAAGVPDVVAAIWLIACRRRSETVASVGEWPPDEKCSAQMITCGFQIRLSEIPKLSELASCGGQGCTATWSSGLRFAVAS